MGKIDIIVRHVNEMPNYNASTCPWHTDRNCFLVMKNDARFHALFTNYSKQWRSYDLTESCDLPEDIYDLMVLNRELGDEYVLPFAYPFRERSGYTIGLYKMCTNLYDSTRITARNLSEMYYTLVVLMCAECRRLGGNAPVLRLSSFLYTNDHPVLVNLGAINCEKRNRDGNRELFSKKKWNRFLREKTCLAVIKYLRNIRPELFRNKFGARSDCFLKESENFDDATHKLICDHRKSNIADVLEHFIHLIKDSRIQCVIKNWIRESKQT